MQRCSAWLGVGAVGFLALCVGAGAARSDDWAQYRHDANHSGVSSDRLTFPLTEVWSSESPPKTIVSPLYHCTIRGGKVFFTNREQAGRFLVCADAKTGSIAWRRRLVAPDLKFPISQIAGPAVSSTGTVFVYDWAHDEDVSSLLGYPNHHCKVMNSFTVRTFDARDGKAGGTFPLAVMGAKGVLRRISLQDTVEGQAVAQVPPTFSGCPP